MRGAEAAIVLRALAALVKTRDELSKQEIVQLFFVSFGFDLPATADVGRNDGSDPFAAKSEAGRIGGKRSAEVRRAQSGTAQPSVSAPQAGQECFEERPEADHDSASKQNSKHPEAEAEAEAEAASKQGASFPPHPLSERNNGSGSEVVESQEGSGSGGSLESGKQESLYARESDSALDSGARNVTPPGRTRKAAKRVGSWRRVPAEWVIKPDQRALALSLIVDVELEAAAFRDHEFRVPKTDPDAAFRNWLRTAAKSPRGISLRKNEPKQPNAGAWKPVVES